MRRLTLILSDLYLPEEAGAPSEQSEFIALPNLEWLLRFATGQRIDDWRRALAAQACADVTEFAPAPFAAAGTVPGDLATTWFATPVHLEARLDHVRLDQRGILRLAAEERRAWGEEFARAFGPALALHDGGPRGFFLSGLEAREVLAVDPARVLGWDIAASLPRDKGDGRNAVALRKLSAEIEMWLHGAALNYERERARLPRISSLWLWGGGAGRPVEMPRRADHAYLGEDPWLAALARAQTGFELRPAPAQFGDLDAAAEHVFVELTPMGAAAGSLAHIDAQWLGPARLALIGGQLEAVEVIANDRHFITRRFGAWRFWRRGRHWMDLLRRPDRATHA
jgi:hypothetical protein